MHHKHTTMITTSPQTHHDHATNRPLARAQTLHEHGPIAPQNTTSARALLKTHGHERTTHHKHIASMGTNTHRTDRLHRKHTTSTRALLQTHGHERTTHHKHITSMGTNTRRKATHYEHGHERTINTYIMSIGHECTTNTS